MSKIGVDISTYQKNVDYDVAVENIKFAIIRVGFGISYLPNKQRDVKFDDHYNGLKGRVPLGAYYYAYGTNYDEGVKEAENCLAYMGDKKFELPIFYDMEENRNTADAGQGFVDRIRQEGLQAGIYASRSFYDRKGLSNIDCDIIWKAAYGCNDGKMHEEARPAGCDIWQYTSMASVDGIGEHIDMDTLEDIPEPGPSPEPSPEPQPEPEPIEYTFEDFVPDVQIAEGQTGKWIDGKVGRRTYELTPTVSTTKNRHHAIVTPLERYLKALGYYDGDIEEDLGLQPTFGEGMKQAVKAYQHDNDCVEDGEITAKNKTWKKLLQLL